tara:strand:- start:309 stop:686 length:378 start_codon:yes stop_codon:yes gene_type:complete
MVELVVAARALRVDGFVGLDFVDEDFELAFDSTFSAAFATDEVFVDRFFVTTLPFVDVVVLRLVEVVFFAGVFFAVDFFLEVTFLEVTFLEVELLGRLVDEVLLAFFFAVDFFLIFVELDDSFID